MDEREQRLAELKEAFDAAGVPLPDKPASMELEELDSLVEDRRLRGKCKSALVKYQRVAGEDEAEPSESAEQPLGDASPPNQEPPPAEPRAEALEPPSQHAPATRHQDASAHDFDAPPEGGETIYDEDRKVADDPAKTEGTGSQPAGEAGEVPSAPAADAPAVELDEEQQGKYDDLKAAFEAAGLPVPDSPAVAAGMEVDELDAQVEDKRLRGKCKSALVKFKRVAGDIAAQPSGTADQPLGDASPPTQEPPPADARREPLGPDSQHSPATRHQGASAHGFDAPPTGGETIYDEDREIEAQPENVSGVEEEEPAPEPEPMPDELQEPFGKVQEAFTAAGVDVPADPVNVDLDSLDDTIEDKMLRGKAKSALVKFRRAAEKAGWEPTPRVAANKRPAQGAVAGEVGAELDDAHGAPSESGGVPRVPQSKPTDLWLLRDGAWVSLGTANRMPSHIDEMVDRKDANGNTERILLRLYLDGKFTVPEDIYNTWCYLAHEGRVYKAYYISHVGDVKRGTKTASLKVDEHFDFDDFVQRFQELGRAERPTADDARRARFGDRYRTPRGMFAEDRPRMI